MCVSEREEKVRLQCGGEKRRGERRVREERERNAEQRRAERGREERRGEEKNKNDSRAREKVLCNIKIKHDKLWTNKSKCTYRFVQLEHACVTRVPIFRLQNIDVKFCLLEISVTQKSC